VWRPPFFSPHAPGPAQFPAARDSAAAMSGEDEAFRDSVFEILLSSHDLVENARALAQKAGFHVEVDNSCDDWDYAAAAATCSSASTPSAPSIPACALMSVGEVTVKLDRTPGAGGRNSNSRWVCALELSASGRAPDRAERRFGWQSTEHQCGRRHRRPHHRHRAHAFGFHLKHPWAAFNALPHVPPRWAISVVTGRTGQSLATSAS